MPALLMVTLATLATVRAHAAPAVAQPPIDAEILALPLAGAGTVNRIDPASAQIDIAGKTLRWHVGRMRVLDDATGKPARIDQVVGGRQVRYAVEPPAAAQGGPARILLIRLAPVL